MAEVPAHRTNRTPKAPGKRPAWAAKFLEELRKRGTVSHAARAVKKGRTTVYDLRDRDPAFAAEWDQAVEEVTDDLEASLLQRAIHGWEEPVFFKGAEVGSVTKFDNTLGFRLLRARRQTPYNVAAGDQGQTGAEGPEDVAAKIRAFLEAAALVSGTRAS